jgi:hypothetical protein
MPAARPAAERFWEKVAPAGTCWEWTASCDKNGHGQFTPRHGKSVRAHRFAYEEMVGPIPEGLVLDHLCRNRPCVNPDHLDPVPQRVNAQRGRTGYNTPKRSQCNQGHPFPEHAQYRSTGTRYCKTCQNAKQRERYATRKEAA